MVAKGDVVHAQLLDIINIGAEIEAAVETHLVRRATLGAFEHAPPSWRQESSLAGTVSPLCRCSRRMCRHLSWIAVLPRFMSRLLPEPRQANQ